jgi:hypothetical protein
VLSRHDKDVMYAVMQSCRNEKRKEIAPRHPKSEIFCGTEIEYLYGTVHTVQYVRYLQHINVPV